MFVEKIFEEDNADDEFPTRIEGLVLSATDEIAFRPTVISMSAGAMASARG
jgi:hypothetical protein